MTDDSRIEAMSPRERVKAAIARLPTDKVPKGELGIERRLRQILLRRWGYSAGSLSEREETWTVMQKLGMDLMGVSPIFPPRRLLSKDRRGRERRIDFWGNEAALVGEAAAVERPACGTWEEFREYTLPALEDVGFKAVEEWCTGPFFTFLLLPGPFGLMTAVANGENVLLWLAAYESEVQKIAEKFSAWLIFLVRRGLAAKADGVILMEDLAGAGGLLMAPGVWRRVFSPFIAALAAEIHRQHAVCFFHSDGDIREIMDDLAETGVDGLHSLEPASGMDLEWLKREYGKKFCLMGNIDCHYLLPCGTPREVEEATLRALNIAAPGGGFILSSAAGVLAADWPPENVEAMYFTAENWNPAWQVSPDP